MARYAGFGNQTITSSAATALSVASNGTTAQRNRIYELVIANEGTPADNVFLFTVQRCTAVGTSTSVTPTKLDPDDRAAQAQCGENHTVEPTYTANQEVLEMALNARATFRWVAAPGGMIICPATANNGVGVNTLHASATTDFGVQAFWEE